MKTTPFWWEDAEPQHADRTFDRDRCEVLIVGAGYTGLSAAITFAEAGVADVIVVESARVGEGASSRNGGQISNAAKFDLATASRRFGERRGHEIMDDYAQAMPFLLKRAETLADPFDLSICGSILAAHSREDIPRFENLRNAAPPDQRNQWEIVPHGEMRRVLQTDIYRGALLRHDAGSLHPAKYVRALANRARALGVRIVTGWRYEGAEAAPGGHRARVRETTTGETAALFAGKILLAVNGYAGPETPWLRKRAIPVRSFMIATEPLPLAQMEALIPHNRVVADTKHVLYYFRRSPDGARMLFGGRASFGRPDEAESAEGLRAFMAHTFPSLRTVGITHSWSGAVCFAYDFMTHAGRQPDGVYYSSCCNGNGVAMSTWMGHRSARLMLGVPGEDRGVMNTRFPRPPLYDGDPWFLPLVGTWYRFLDRKARWSDRRGHAIEAEPGARRP